jgi:hypothetical protein
MEEATAATIGQPPKAPSRLKLALSKPKAKPRIFTIFGEGGVGKTHLFSTFPAPVLIRTEDGTESIAGKPVYMFDVAQSYADIIDQLTMLIQDDHGFKTVGIDTITRMELMFEAEVVRKDPNQPKSIGMALGGYGNGAKAVAAMHMEVRRLCGILNEAKRMNVVFLGHATTETITLPDMEPYNRFSVRMSEKSRTHYTDDVDIVGLIRLDAHTIKRDKRVTVSSSEDRLIQCQASADSIAKNRCDIREDILYTRTMYEAGTNPLEAYVIKE